MLFKTLVVFFVVYCCSNFSHGLVAKKFFRSDYTYLDDTQSFYKIHTTKKTWIDAKRTCAEEGATFFYPADRNEANAVISFWKENQPTIQWLWIGLSDIISEGDFETIDGKPVSQVYHQWQQNQPDDYLSNEDCVHFNLQGNLNDFSCDAPTYYICKRSLCI